MSVEILPVPKGFVSICKLVATAEKENMKVVVQTEGASMPLKRIEPADGGVRIRYGTTSRGQYSTVLKKIHAADEHACCAVDEDDEDVFILAKPIRAWRMGVIPATETTPDDQGYVGRVFGKLVILKIMGWSGRQRMALCSCSCGGMKLARISSLLVGWVISCGCMRGKNTELPLFPGSKYGNLTVIRKVPRPPEQKRNGGYYLVKCICGVEQIRVREHIVTPKNPDCGCRGHSKLVGQRFGSLVVIPGDKKEGRQRLVKTRCDCGAETFARVYALKNGKKKSCGCGKSALRAIQPNS